MARIAYIDHSYHKKTLSTDFLPAILRKYGHVVDYYWDDSWIGGERVNWNHVSNYDVIIMFQSYCKIDNDYYRNLHPNTVFIPMLDQFGIWQGPLINLTGFWEPFQGSKVLNFSGALHAMTIGFGVRSFFLRYYQSARESRVDGSGGLKGFFWLRRETELPWALVRQLITNTEFESFHIHLATDPGTKSPTLPTAEDIKKFNITTSTWFDRKADFEAVLDNANVFFAPRVEEGIGQSFLEAFSRGQCVVAPNHGSMNEYIISGLNGLLYDLKSPVPLDFSSALILGENARKAAEYGRQHWENSEQKLLEFILTPSEELYFGKYCHSLYVRPEGHCFKERLRYLSRSSFLLRKTRPLWLPIKKFLGKFF
jgi:hypothetical protein